TRAYEFSRGFEPDPYDPAKARKLMAEAGYPNGFDAGEFYPWPPYFSMGEALAAYLQTIGIKTKIRTMERAAMTTAWREKKLKNLIVGITGAGGNAATRLEAYVSKNGIYTAGVMPDVEDLFQRQARETDTKKREALLHQIQGLLHERVTHIPIYELAFIWGVGPLVVKEPQGDPHAAAVDLVVAALRAAFGTGWLVRAHAPLALGLRSRPEPDVSVVYGSPRDYRRAAPTEAVLVVEVSQTSLAFD